MTSGYTGNLPPVSAREDFLPGSTMSGTQAPYSQQPPAFSAPYPTYNQPQQQQQQQQLPQYGYGSPYPPPGGVAPSASPPNYSEAMSEPGTWDAERGDEPKPEDNIMGDMGTFSEKSIRNAFIKKVFGILVVQLLITAGVVSIFLFVEPVKEYTANNSWVYITASVLVIVMIVSMGCADSLRRKFPANLILLLIFTVVMSVMLGAFAGAFETDEILIALGAVVAVTILMTLLGLQTKIDFTACLGLACSFGMVLFYFAIMCAIFRARYSSLAYACLGAALFSLWLVIDIQLLMGGKRSFVLNPEDYIFAAMQIYIDIIYIFIFILSIVGMSKN